MTASTAAEPCVIWRAQPKQRAFMERPEYEALYGGAAGGGKSDALLCEALRQVAVPHYKGIILRKTYPELSELVGRSRQLYSAAYPEAQYVASEHVWRFPSGAQVFFGAMQHAEDRTKYQGRQFDFIAFDELTHFTFEEYAYMFSRNRPSGPGTRVYLRAATNPGGVGHSWVKERFIKPAPPLTPMVEEVKVMDGDRMQTLRRSRIFIPSTVLDNQELLRNAPDYLANLAMLPESERNALLYGSWDSFDGQVFSEWKDDPCHREDGKWTHVISPFPIPPDWRIWRGFDFGYARPFAVGWFAADCDGRLYMIREWYGCTGVPNEGVRMHPADIAAGIRRIENEDPNLRGRTITGIADPSIFDESRGESVARMMERAPSFVYWEHGDNTRLPGKMQFHRRLAFDEEGLPSLQVFETCRNFVRTVPALTYDPQRPEDIDTRSEDHIYDMVRYVLMEQPISPPAKEKIVAVGDDPLELRGQRWIMRR